MSPMPTLTEYQDAIQNPHSCFSDYDLQAAVPETNKIGLPRPYSGNFAVVFPMSRGSNKWAVRCFSTYYYDQELRYEKISQYLRQKQLSCMVGFDFLKQGIKVRGKWYPILKMEWVHGESLNKFIEKNLNNPQEIQTLTQKFLQLIAELRQCNIAHGDLQHGNILIVNGCFRLVDYDGMYVPGFDGMSSNELGHRNYQHPSRNSHDFGPYLDNFSAWCIYVALVALSADPGLRRLVNVGDDHLLFRRQDIEDPDSSLVMRSLKKIRDSNVQSLVNVFHTLIYCPNVSQIPPLDASQIPPATVQPMKTGGQEPVVRPNVSWVFDHLEVPKVELPTPSILERAFAKAFVISLIIFVYVSINKTLMMPLEVAAIVAFGVSSILALVLNLRFKSLHQISKKAKLSSELNDLKSHIRNIENTLNYLANDKSKLEQEKGKKIGEITLKQRDTAQMERNDIAKVEIDLRNTLSSISSKRQGLLQAETNELAKALESIQAQYLHGKLSQHDLTTQSIMGIGPEMTKRLWANGIKTAADISNVQVVQHGYGRSVHDIAYIVVHGGGRIHVEGIGPKKAHALLSWKQGIERNLKGYMPKSLPQGQENAIRSKYLAQRRSLDVQESDAKRRAGEAGDAIVAKYRKEKAALEKQLADARELFGKDLKEVDDKLAVEKKKQSEKNWAFRRLELRFKPYHQITFSGYVKRAFFS